MLSRKQLGQRCLAVMALLIALPGGLALAQTAGTAYVRVLLPPGAENATVTFGTQVTKEQTGRDRWFVTPTLEPGKKYYYEVSATWSADGKEVNRKQKVYVTPGQTAMIDFNKGDAETKKDDTKKDDTKKDDTKKDDTNKDDTKKDDTKKDDTKKDDTKKDDTKKQQTGEPVLSIRAFLFINSPDMTAAPAGRATPLWIRSQPYIQVQA
jgi:uncharacterized protein (TIGR03000 family)